MFLKEELSLLKPLQHCADMSSVPYSTCPRIQKNVCDTSVKGSTDMSMKEGNSYLEVAAALNSIILCHILPVQNLTNVTNNF